jgi:threonine dehydratase
MIATGDVQDAAVRIAPYVRKTPCFPVSAIRERATEPDLWLKLRSLQPNGSFKARGATVRIAGATWEYRLAAERQC